MILYLENAANHDPLPSYSAPQPAYQPAPAPAAKPLSSYKPVAAPSAPEPAYGKHPGMMKLFSNFGDMFNKAKYSVNRFKFYLFKAGN